VNYRVVVVHVLLFIMFSSAVAITKEDGPGENVADEGLEKALAGVDEIVFAVRAEGTDGHWYANFGYWASDEKRMMYGEDGGRLCALNWRSGKVRTLLDAGTGSVRDPHVHYSGKKILFSRRKSGSKYYHLYEINTDGSELTQLTHGEFDDLEPVYLPDGGIMFVSSRCNRWVNCWHTQVAVLYRCDADGSNIQALSANIEQDNTPWVMPDGRILYTRWEYVDRSRVKYHHLWTMNPDGTGQMIHYGNMHQGTVMIDAKPIPGTENTLSVFSPNHGKKEHAGQITIVNAKRGPDDKSFARKIPTAVNCRDPYPLTKDLFLAAQDRQMLLLNSQGRTQVLYSLPNHERAYRLHEPRPLRQRQREPVIPARVKPEQNSGFLILADIRHGRNMGNVKKGEIKKLLVLETLPKPINHSGTMEPLSLDGTFTLPRILGTVPVEEDGSAYIELPALRSLFFVALDENDKSVKRMQSFLTVMPGEVTSCVGCHEKRTDAARDKAQATLLALQREPSQIRPIPNIPEVFDFPRDIQPILDRRCVSCHSYQRREGDTVLSGEHGPVFSHSYVTLMTGWVSHGRDAGGNLPPRAIGSSASRLMSLVNGSHHDVSLTKHEQRMIRLWIESGAPYAGTYASLGTGMVGMQQRNEDTFIKKSTGMKQRCLICHGKDLPVHVELRYNLTEPKESLVLLAPLAQEAGGYGICKSKGNKGSHELFKTSNDPDYQRLLADIQKYKKQLDARRRFDMPGFRPNEHYVREMMKYKILPHDFDLREDPIDVYAVDRMYWKSLWYQAVKQ
jgi:hypothetical protein